MSIKALLRKTCNKIFCVLIVCTILFVWSSSQFGREAQTYNRLNTRELKTNFSRNKPETNNRLNTQELKTYFPAKQMWNKHQTKYSRTQNLFSFEANVKPTSDKILRNSKTYFSAKQMCFGNFLSAGFVKKVKELVMKSKKQLKKVRQKRMIGEDRKECFDDISCLQTNIFQENIANYHFFVEKSNCRRLDRKERCYKKMTERMLWGNRFFANKIPKSLSL